jgi:hypothetical protein
MACAGARSDGARIEPTERRMKRRPLACVAATGAVGVLLGGCVLADPPATLPVVEESVPSIQNDVVPPPGFIATWPKRFIVPVFVLDPTQPLKWVAYVDYNSFTNGAIPLPINKAPVPVSDDSDGGIRTVLITTLEQPTGPGCHTLKIVFGSEFQGFVPIDPPGGVVVGWTFTGSGTPGDCMPFDAGAFSDGTFPDSGKGDGASLDGGV